jgi:hypothetical protein
MPFRSYESYEFSESGIAIYARVRLEYMGYITVKGCGSTLTRLKTSRHNSLPISEANQLVAHALRKTDPHTSLLKRVFIIGHRRDGKRN